MRTQLKYRYLCRCALLLAVCALQPATAHHRAVTQASRKSDEPKSAAASTTSKRPGDGVRHVEPPASLLITTREKDGRTVIHHEGDAQSPSQGEVR